MRTDGHWETRWYAFADVSAELLYEILRFRQAIFVVEQHSPYPDLDGLDQRASHLVLRRDGDLVAGLRVIPYPGDGRVAIGRVAVAEALRGQGIARRLMHEALAHCRRDHGGWTVTISAQTYLAPFYETLGFRAVSSEYDDFGVPHVDMLWAKRR